MKTSLLTILIIISSFSLYSQIFPWDGIVDIDSCKFEEDCHIAIIDTSLDNVWQVGTPGKLLFDSAYSFDKALMTDTIQPYDTLISSHFDLVLSNFFLNVLVSFKHKFNTDTLLDGGYIDISYDYGQTWKNIIEDNTPMAFFFYENLYSTNDSLIDGKYGFSGTTSDWLHTRIQWIWDLPVKSYSDTIILRFNFVSDSIQTYKDGWIIDDIIISWTDTGGSVDEIDNLKPSKAYPNPFFDFTEIEFENSKMENHTLEIYSINGQLVKTIHDIYESNVKVKRDFLTNGMYYYHLINNNQIISIGKLIIE